MRAWAIFAAIAPAIGMGVVGWTWPHASESPAVAPTLAVLAALPLLLRSPREWRLLGLGVALGILAALAVARFDHVRDSAPVFRLASPWVFFDLTREPLPPELPAWIAAHGYLHPGSALDEYDVPLGERPDQSQPPQAVLVPFLGRPQPSPNSEPQGEAPPEATDPVPHQGPILIARVDPGVLAGNAPLTLRGRVRPLPEGLLATLVDVEGDSLGRGLVLDTMTALDRRAAVLAGIAAALATLLSALCYLAACPTEPKP